MEYSGTEPVPQRAVVIQWAPNGSDAGRFVPLVQVECSSGGERGTHVCEDVRVGSDNVVRQNRELIIFVTPRLVVDMASK